MRVQLVCETARDGLDVGRASAPQEVADVAKLQCDSCGTAVTVTVRQDTPEERRRAQRYTALKMFVSMFSFIMVATVIFAIVTESFGKPWMWVVTTVLAVALSALQAMYPFVERFSLLGVESPRHSRARHRAIEAPLAP